MVVVAAAVAPWHGTAAGRGEVRAVMEGSAHRPRRGRARARQAACAAPVGAQTKAGEPGRPMPVALHARVAGALGS